MTDIGHQSQLAPAHNKYHKGNGDDKKHYWLTPWSDPVFVKLSEEFGDLSKFYDPCPYPRPANYDGLRAEWGEKNYVNPPFGSVLVFETDACKHETDPVNKYSRTCIHCGEVGTKIGPTFWVRKAIAESRKGKLVILVYPVDKWSLMLSKEIFGEFGDIRNLGDVRWRATEDYLQGKGTGRHIACFILRASTLSSQDRGTP